MKSVLISIQSKWCEKIINGEKTVEIRKTYPKLETPFKCYIYCTKGKGILWSSDKYNYSYKYVDEKSHNIFDKSLNGRVIGEFVCDEIREYYPINIDNPINKPYGDEIEKDSCLSTKQVNDYAWRTLGYGILYGWHISDLVIYDEPRELREFYIECQMNCEHCEMWGYTRVNADEFDMDCKSDWFNHKPLKRPPQSWCYVQEE